MNIDSDNYNEFIKPSGKNNSRLIKLEICYKSELNLKNI